MGGGLYGPPPLCSARTRPRYQPRSTGLSRLLLPPQFLLLSCRLCYSQLTPLCYSQLTPPCYSPLPSRSSCRTTSCDTLPSILMTKVRSIIHKMDKLELLTIANQFVQNCCLMIILESWLHPLIPDAAIQLAVRISHRHDRGIDSGKSRGGGLCVYVHKDWCNNNRILSRHCCLDLEALTVLSRPFYLHREVSVITVTAVYIPPDANVSTALSYLLAIVKKQQKNYPDGVHTIAGDFNQAYLKTVLPHFYQHVDCATWGRNTLGRVYSNQSFHSPTLRLVGPPFPGNDSCLHPSHKVY